MPDFLAATFDEGVFLAAGRWVKAEPATLFASLLTVGDRSIFEALVPMAFEVVSFFCFVAMISFERQQGFSIGEYAVAVKRVLSQQPKDLAGMHVVGVH